MSNIKAVGYFMSYCQRYMGREGYHITQEFFNQGTSEIFASPEGRFRNCQSETDVIRELGLER